MIRKSTRLVPAVAACIVSMLASMGPAEAADDAFTVEGLEAGTEVMFANVPSRITECWEEGLDSAPRLYQRVQGKWKRLSVATVSRDVATCGRRTPIKAVYELTLLPVGRANVAEDYYEARMLTTCDGCQTYRWKIPFRNTDSVF